MAATDDDKDSSTPSIYYGYLCI